MNITSTYRVRPGCTTAPAPFVRTKQFTRPKCKQRHVICNIPLPAFHFSFRTASSGLMLLVFAPSSLTILLLPISNGKEDVGLRGFRRQDHTTVFRKVPSWGPDSKQFFHGVSENTNDPCAAIVSMMEYKATHRTSTGRVSTFLTSTNSSLVELGTEEIRKVN